MGFSVWKSSTTKNKSGKIWKVFVCLKQGYREPRKTPPQGAVALANAISRARENVEERRVKRRRVETREGCNARMVMSSTNDGQFKNALCSAIGATPSLASDVPTPFYPPFLQNLAIEILDELVEPGLHKMDIRNKDEVIIRMKPAVASKQCGQENIICSLTADACIELCPKIPVNLNVDNALVVKLAGRGLHNSSVVRGMDKWALGQQR
ncbi:hypothetical protein Cgig2_033477 [Carnegiea gigantea]|uniref:FAR1 domain-containing protein n=1 Tax=Carnegiea gigantea TaxID=171969 RepID=A0A9Q1JH83_9CARY|nr:hypothetical protein Cgig2_033477 [Carnegiea gigantea]